VAKLSEFTTDPHNANKGTQRGLKALDTSVRKYGMGRSILADRKGRIIAGNKTAERAADIGIEDVIVVESDGTKLVVVKRTDLDLEDDGGKARALATYDNRSGQLDLDWDIDALSTVDADVLKDLWTVDELDELGIIEKPQGDAEPQIDRAAELQEKWQVKTGDLWKIGDHRLLCGDSTKREDVEKVMGGEKAGAVVTDPPYGMDLNTDYSDMPETKIASKTYKRVEGDNKDFDASPYIDMFDYCQEQFWWGGDYYYPTLPPHGSWVIWDKRNENSDGLVGNHFEICWSRQVHRRRMIREHWSGVNARNQGMKRSHPTEKSIKVISEIVSSYTDENAIVVDLFAGVGTLIVACQNLGRKCRAIEISPEYCAVTLERMAQAFPGIEIERQLTVEKQS